MERAPKAPRAGLGASGPSERRGSHGRGELREQVRRPIGEAGQGPAGERPRRDELTHRDRADEHGEERGDDHRMGANERGGPVTESPLDRLALVGFVDRALLLEDPLGRGEPAWRAEAGGLHEAPEGSVANTPCLLRPPPPGKGAGEVGEVPTPRGRDVDRFLEPSTEHEVHEAHGSEQERRRHDPQERRK